MGGLPRPADAGAAPAVVGHDARPGGGADPGRVGGGVRPQLQRVRRAVPHAGSGARAPAAGPRGPRGHGRRPRPRPGPPALHPGARRPQAADRDPPRPPAGRARGRDPPAAPPPKSQLPLDRTVRRDSPSAPRACPLAGVTVLELGGMFAAPFGATVLADLGARVIKVEPLDGDTIRGDHGLPRGGRGQGAAGQGEHRARPPHPRGPGDRPGDRPALRRGAAVLPGRRGGQDRDRRGRAQGGQPRAWCT